jgi:hypothetical protein
MFAGGLAMMLRSIRFTGFRCLPRFSLEGLTRVNLVVGANNVGKSAVLEGAQILLNKDTGSAMASVSLRRREMVVEESTNQGLPDVRHLFHGHQIHQGAQFRIEAEAGSSRRHVEALVAQGADIDLKQGIPRLPINLRDAPKVQTLLIDRAPKAEVGLFPLSGKGGLVWAPSASMDTLLATPEPPVRVMAGEMRSTTLFQLWEQVALTPEEAQVIEAVRIIESEMERIALIAPMSGYAKLRNRDERLPLTGMGDGFHRLLILALELVAARGGYLLIDEIDIGLHYSIMTRLWQLIIEAARRLDVQVLATSHSLDCLRGLARWVGEHPEFAEEVSLHRLERQAETSIRFSGKEIVVAVEHEMELR